MPVDAQDDTVPVERQCKLELIEEKYDFEFLRCALRQNLSRVCRSTTQTSPRFCAFPNGEQVALR
jgi:hypothetical protein